MAQQLYNQVFKADASTTLLRDILCEALADRILLPLVSLLTPQSFNALLLCSLRGRMGLLIKSLTLRITMSAQSFLSQNYYSSWMEATDDGLQYVAVLSRFQAESLLLHAPDGAFLLRRSSPYAQTFHLSYCRRVQRVLTDVERPQSRLEVIHEMIYRDCNGYLCKHGWGMPSSCWKTVPSLVRVYCGETKCFALRIEDVSRE